MDSAGDYCSALETRWIASGEPAIWHKDNATYSEVESFRLPPLPDLDAYWAWLSTQPRATACLDWERDNTTAGIGRICAEAGVRLPDFASKFLEDSSLYTRVPSCTGCFLELSEQLIPVPGYEGEFLLRFLNDSQSVCIWYLHLTRNGSEKVVVSPYLLDPEIFAAMGYLEERDEESASSYEECFHESIVCESDFERFICRFSIENRIWFSLRDDNMLTATELAYYESATQSRT